MAPPPMTTALSTWPTLDQHDFGHVKAEWYAWVQEASAPAIQPTLEFYRLALERGWQVDELHIERGQLDEVFRQITTAGEEEART